MNTAQAQAVLAHDDQDGWLVNPLALTDAEQARFDRYRRSSVRSLTLAQRKAAYALAYRRFLTVRYATKASPRGWLVSEAAAALIRREIDAGR